MSGRGKGGKGLGKGGAKRHRKVLRDNIQGITKPAIRRLCRRGGVKRISGLTYEETRGVLKVFLENVIRDSVTYTEHARRKTVTARDVVFALKKQGRTLYGFGSDTMFFQSIRPKARRAPSATPGPLPPPPGPSTGAPGATTNIAQKRATRNQLNKEILENCEELDSCCNVGMYLNEIFNYFDKFENFRYVTNIENIAIIDVVEIYLKNERNTNELITMLKMIDSTQDISLVYDYFITSFFHEEKRPQYPNTVKALNLCTFKSQSDYDYCAHNFQNVTVQDLQQKLTFFDEKSNPIEIIKESSKKHYMFCFHQIIVPYYYDLSKMFEKNSLSDDFWKYDAATTFFQIYSFLRSHQKLFTHYNLTAENIILSDIPSTSFYNFIYKEKNAKIIEFRSRYLVKIINFSKSVVTEITDIFYDNIKGEKSGQNGYSDVMKNFKSGINTSEDLLLLYNIQNYKGLDKLKVPEDLKILLKKISYQHNHQRDDTNKSIRSVEGVYQELLQHLQKPTTEKRNINGPGLYGTFKIHTDIIDRNDNISLKSYEFKKSRP